MASWPWLTSPQWEAMKTAAEGGKMYGYLLERTVPSLIKHGLIVKGRVKGTEHSLGIAGMRYSYRDAREPEPPSDGFSHAGGRPLLPHPQWAGDVGETAPQAVRVGEG